MVELSNCDVISGSKRLLAVEIDKLSLMTNEKTQITCERYIIHTKHVLIANREPWSFRRQMTLFPVSGVTELVKSRHKCKNG
jgi:hypothetical protein